MSRWDRGLTGSRARQDVRVCAPCGAGAGPFLSAVVLTELYMCRRIPPVTLTMSELRRNGSVAAAGTVIKEKQTNKTSKPNQTKPKTKQKQNKTIHRWYLFRKISFLLFFLLTCLLPRMVPPSLYELPGYTEHSVVFKHDHMRSTYWGAECGFAPFTDFSVK